MFAFTTLVTFIISICPLTVLSIEGDLFYFTSFAEPEEWAQVYSTCREDFDFQYLREETDKRYVHYMNKTGFINISSPIPQTPEPLSLNKSWIPRSLTPITIKHDETICQDPNDRVGDCINRNPNQTLHRKVLLIRNPPSEKPGSHFVSYGFQKSKKCVVANDYSPCHISPRLGRIRGLVLSANRSAENADQHRLTVEDPTQFPSIRATADGTEYVFSEAIFMGTGEDNTDCSSSRGSHVINGRCYPMEIYMYFVNPNLPAMASTIILVVPVEEANENQDNLEIRSVVSAARKLYVDEKLFLKTHRRKEILEKNYHTLGPSTVIRYLAKDERDTDYFTLPSSVEIERIETLLLDHWERIQTYKTSTLLLYEELSRIDDKVLGLLARHWRFDKKFEKIPPNLFIEKEPFPNDTSTYLTCTDNSTVDPKAKLCTFQIYLHLYLAQYAFLYARFSIRQRDNISSEFGRTPLGHRVRRVPTTDDHTYKGLLRIFGIPESEHNRSSVDLFGVTLPPEMDELSDPPGLLPNPSFGIGYFQIRLVKYTEYWYGYRMNPNHNQSGDDILLAREYSYINIGGWASSREFLRTNIGFWFGDNGMGYVIDSPLFAETFLDYISDQVLYNYQIAILKFLRHSEKFDTLYDSILILGLPQTIASNGDSFEFTESIYDAGSPGEFMDNHIKGFLNPTFKDHPLKYQKLKKTEPVQANIKTPAGERLISLGNMGMTQEDYEDHENLKHPTMIVGNKFQISWLIPEGGGYYRYKGSSPVPPCYGVEDVIVFRRPIRMTKFQIASLTRVPRSQIQDRDIRNTFGMRHKLRGRNSNPYAGKVFYEPRNHQFLDDDGVHENSILKKQKRESKADRGSGCTSGLLLLSIITFIVLQ